ncbi:MAG: hypothetical protein NVS3B21_24400 [Acidimicrobiales bacterium]
MAHCSGLPTGAGADPVGAQECGRLRVSTRSLALSALRVCPERHRPGRETSRLARRGRTGVRRASQGSTGEVKSVRLGGPHVVSIMDASTP